MLAVVLPPGAQVSYDRIQRADAEPGNWLTYSGNYSTHRCFPLGQTNAAKVRRLRLDGVYQINTTEHRIAHAAGRGRHHVSERSGGSMTALDTLTGWSLWKYARTLPNSVRGCCGSVKGEE